MENEKQTTSSKTPSIRSTAKAEGTDQMVGPTSLGIPADESENKRQSRAYCLCFNKINETGYNLERLKDICADAFSSVRYYCISEEIGLESKLQHAHVFLYCDLPKRFGTVKNKFPNSGVHIEDSRGSPEQNRDYVFKIGKWANDPKADTKIPGRQFEWGTLPKSSQGQHSPEALLIEAIRSGDSNSQLLEKMPDIAARYYRDLDRIRIDFAREKFGSSRRLNLKVNYIFGATGTGKTRGVLDKHGDAIAYRVTDYQHPFDGYDSTRHSVIVFDEFRSSLKLSDMLQYLDVYPIDLPCRYANKFAAYETVYVISNEPFESQYSDYAQTTDPDKKRTYSAWKRRFNGFIKEYHEDGSIQTWPSLEEYFASKTEFPPLPDSQNPFLQ